ncbi:MAG: transposase [Deltaproteobacteria bacterium]|jgi:putative transposase|nr:transposase [Deltaproteobacteria bacterium]
MSRDLTALKKEEEWLKELPSRTLQQTLIKLDRSIAASFKEGAGFPRFRSGSELGTDAVTLPNSPTWRLDRKRVYLPKMKEGIVYDKYRPFRGGPVQLEIVKEAKDWFAIVTREAKDPDPPPVDPEKVVGLDLGVKRLGATSDGKFKKPQDLTKADANKARPRRELERRSRRTKDGKLKPARSKRRAKTLKTPRKASRRGENKRKDYPREYSRQLADRIERLGAEKLGTKRMTGAASGTAEKPGKNVARKRSLNRAVLAMGWATLIATLKNKLEMKGWELILVEPRFTSQIR